MAEIIQFPAKLPKIEAKKVQVRPGGVVDEIFRCDSCKGFPPSGDSPLWKEYPARCVFGQCMSFAMPKGHPDFEPWGYYPMFRPCEMFKEQEEE